MLGEGKSKLMSPLKEALRSLGSSKTKKQDARWSTPAPHPRSRWRGAAGGMVANGWSTTRAAGRTEAAGTRARHPEEVVFLRATKVLGKQRTPWEGE